MDGQKSERNDRSVRRRGENQILVKQGTEKVYRRLGTREAQQVMHGTVSGIWVVVDEAPTRNMQHALVWKCQCPFGHVLSIEHSMLAYNTVPQTCAQCAQESQLQKAAAKLAEKQAANDALREWRAAQKAARAAQFPERVQVKEGVEANV
jgi:hypothetical protein